MNRREFQIGPGAASLLLIAVVLCMGVLSALTLVSARGDAQLSMRSVDMAEATAQLNLRAEQTMAQLDGTLDSLSGAESDEEYLAQLAAQLPAGVELSGRTLTWEESDEGGRRLSCAAEVAPLGESPRVYWVEHRVWTQLEEENPEDELLYSDPGALMLPGEAPEELDFVLS